MSDIQDLWDAGDPQAPSGFKDWGEAVTDLLHYEEASVDDIDSHTFDLPSGLSVVYFGWAGRSKEDSPQWVGMRVNGDDDDEYARAAYTVGPSGTDESSFGANESAMIAGRIGTDSSQRESSFEGVLIRGERITMSGTGHHSAGGGDSDQRVVHASGRYRVFGEDLESITLRLSPDELFRQTRMYVKGY